MTLALPLVLALSVAQATPARALVLEPGAQAPERGVFLPEAFAVEQARRLDTCETEWRRCETMGTIAPVFSPGVIVAILGAVFVGGVVTGALAHQALAR